MKRILASIMVFACLTLTAACSDAPKKEAERQQKYIEYLTEKRTKIENMRINQHQVLKENYLEPKGLETIILNRKRNLWERQIKSDDFLNVRLGIGTIPLKINLNYFKSFRLVKGDIINLLADFILVSQTKYASCFVLLRILGTKKLATVSGLSPRVLNIFLN